MKTQKRQLTPEELAECAALKAIFVRAKSETGLTQEAAADALGFKTQGAVSQYLNGKIALNLSVAIKFSGLLNVPISDFSKRLAASTSIAAIGPASASIKPGMVVAVVTADELIIPQYNTGGMGGNGLILRDQPGIIQNWSVSREWLSANVPYCSNPSNLCIVTGFGDSMPDMYSPGDPVLVDLGVKLCDHDGVFFFRVGDEGFIKRLQRIPGEGIRVISQNKEYETWTIKPSMDFEVFGKVLKAWKGRTY